MRNDNEYLGIDFKDIETCPPITQLTRREFIKLVGAGITIFFFYGKTGRGGEKVNTFLYESTS